MYSLEFLPIAKNDIDNIIFYISHNLNNISAARKISKSFINVINNITYFPYGIPVYKNNKNLKYEYRCAKVKNYLIFYTINEKEKKITIVRVLYRKMNISSILK